MDPYTRGLLAGLLLGEGSFQLNHPNVPVTAVRLHVRSERFLREMHQAVGLGVVYGPYEHDGRRSVFWKIHRISELAALCDLLDEDGFADLCDWVGYRYERMRTAVRRKMRRTNAGRGQRQAPLVQAAKARAAALRGRPPAEASGPQPAPRA